MSPRYVGHSWGLSRRELWRVMEIDADAGRDTAPRTVADVLVRTGLTLEELQVRVEASKEREGEQGLRGGRSDPGNGEPTGERNER